MYTGREFLWRAFGLIVMAAAVLVFLRVAFPDPIGTWWSATPIGAWTDDVGSRFAHWLFQPGSPAISLAEATQRGVAYLTLQLTTGNLVSAVLGALGVGVFNLSYNWLRNWSIRRTCSAMLYSSAYRILTNIGVIYRGFTRNGKPYFDSLKTEPETKTLTLKNSEDVRAAMHRLKCEMETLQDFAIAYDYAIWRGLRFLTAKVRIRAMAVREALEVAVAEIEHSKDDNMNFRPARLGVSAAMAYGHDYLDLTDALYPVLSTTVELAERLEVGFVRSFFLWWWPGEGASLPASAPKLRESVRKYLIDWRHKYWKRQLRDSDSWDILWVASGGASSSRWSKEIQRIVSDAGI
ncbi:MAG: hypothetical protein ACKVRO_11135 [Micropepsaceae bacterium]